MISNSLIPYKTFNACSIACIPNGFFVHPNNKEGSVSQWVYVYYGDGLIECTNGKSMHISKELHGVLHEIPIDDFLNTQLTVTGGNNGFHYIAINPIPTTKRFNAEVINETTQRSITGFEKETIIFCLEGKIQCNGVEIDTWKFASIENNKTVSLTVPQNSVALLLTER